jgi:hypothetical protein
MEKAGRDPHSAGRSSGQGGGLAGNAPVSDPARDHLFISYAWEDGAFAEWLALKLTAEGYRVWCDRFKLLGGESYPQDIDRAIREQTFRLLALMSYHSVNKPNPLKERTLALNLARERKEDFLIPLNVDGLAPTEVGWMLSDLSYISFHRSWADGLSQLLKKLLSLDAPRRLAADGRGAVTDWFTRRDAVSTGPERLWTNLLAIEELSTELLCVTLGSPPAAELLATWPHYRQSDCVYWAFRGARPWRGAGRRASCRPCRRRSPGRRRRVRAGRARPGERSHRRAGRRCTANAGGRSFGGRAFPATVCGAEPACWTSSRTSFRLVIVTVAPCARHWPNARQRSMSCWVSRLPHRSPPSPNHHRSQLHRAYPSLRGSSDTVMISATAIGAGSSFVETSEHLRFADFCDACRRYRYIGLCYGVPGVGKTLSARTYAEWALVQPLVFPGAAYVDTVPSAVGECRTLFYTPPVVNSPARIASELERLRNLLNWVLSVAQVEPGHVPEAATNDQTELVVIDEADRLKMAGLEQVRDLYDQSPWGLVLLSMPGLERQPTRRRARRGLRAIRSPLVAVC